MTKHGFESNEKQLVRLFNAFNYHKNGFLSFHEVLLGLAAIEPATAHGEARVKFIFRFYDRKNKGMLLESDFRKMVNDIHPDLASNEAEFEKKVRDCMRAFKITQVGGTLGKAPISHHQRMNN